MVIIVVVTITVATITKGTVACDLAHCAHNSSEWSKTASTDPDVTTEACNTVITLYMIFMYMCVHRIAKSNLLLSYLATKWQKWVQTAEDYCRLHQPSSSHLYPESVIALAPTSVTIEFMFQLSSFPSTILTLLMSAMWRQIHGNLKSAMLIFHRSPLLLA